MHLSSLIVGAVFLALAGSLASANEPNVATGAGVASDADEEAEKAEKKARKWAKKRAKKKAGKKEKKRPNRRVDLGGRLFFRGTLSQVDLEARDDDPWVQDVDVTSARLTADYRRKKLLRVMVEVEVANGDPGLKDGYIEVRPTPELTLKGGRFKRPMSAIALEGSWRLPMVERGLLSDLEPTTAAELPFGGRGEGAEIAYELAGVAMKPTLTAALFEHSIAESVIDVAEHFALDPYARLHLTPAPGLGIGASVALVTHQKRFNDTESINHAAVAGLDVEAKLGPVKAWIEGFFGQSTVYAEEGTTRGNMWAARAVLWWRTYDVAPWLERIGPFVGASIFDPSTAVDDDRGRQVSGGVAAKLDKALRLQLEVEKTWIDDVDLLLTSDRLALYLQLGAAF